MAAISKKRELLKQATKTSTRGEPIRQIDLGQKASVDSRGFTLQLHELQLGGIAVEKSAINGEYHSQLAMHAAKRMRRSKQKLKVGQEVCHHLRMMLASKPADNRYILRSDNQFLLGL